MRKRLIKYNIPEPILAGWEKRFNGKLLPLQYRAIEDYGLLNGESLLISAPTSSGKTFCGELAIVRAVQERKKAIFLTPLKAVTEEKFRQFSDCYGEIGLRIVIGTRDHPEYDADIENGRFDIAVMVYEKFNSLLLINFDLMAQVGTLVLDELQMLGDDTRGPRLELTLTKLLFSEYNPQLVVLSAVLGEAAGLAEWLGCRLLLEKSRPVELRRGIASEGRFCFRCHNSGEIGEEPFKEAEDSILSLFENIKKAFDSIRTDSKEFKLGKQVLIFLKSRYETVRAAQRFAEYAGLESMPENRKFFDERLADEEESSLLENLKSLLACGVAFHNADLTVSQRMAVEQGYRAGLVRVIFATTTLSTGINLPAATVFMEAQKYCRHGYGGRPELEPLSWSEYENMSGRAGRVGWMRTDDADETGRAVLFASSELEKSILWDYYIDKRPAPLQSKLHLRNMADIVVDLFSSELVKRREEVERLLSRSYHAFCNGFSFNVKDEIYSKLLEKNFLCRQGNILSAAPPGKAAAVTGLSVEGADYLIKAYDSLLQAGCDMQIIHNILHSPEGREIYLPRSRRRESISFGDHLFPPSAEDNPLIREITALRRELTPDEMSRLRLTFLLADWMRGMSTLDIESNYNLHPGMMENIAHQTRWLFSSAALVIRAYDRFSDLPARLERLAFSAGTGLPDSLREIHDRLRDYLFRSELISLYKEGVNTLMQLIDSDPALLGEIVSSKERLKKLMQKLKIIKEGKMHADTNRLLGQITFPQSIEIDGTPVRERFLVRINGRPIGLTGKSFKYLFSLAWSRLTKDNGWLYKEDLEQGFNQARYLYRLRKEVGRDFMPDWPLYENNRSGYYRLIADREKIKVNVDALKENPDYEIRKMASDLVPLPAS